MPVNKQERDHDNRERGSLSNSSTNSVSGDNSPASSGPGPENSGPQNPGQMGSESTGHAEGAGGTRFPGAVLGADEPAESGSRRADGPSGSGNQRTGATGAEGDRYSPGNFRLASLADLGAGGAKSKYKDNIAALALLQQLDTDKRQANSAEQAILARYVGWGGIPQVFDATNTDWEKEYARLSELLTADEYEAARSSTLNAHYTSGEVIDGLYSGLKRLGVSDGVRILEPASGIGHFAGKLPFSAEMTLNELDVVSARISRHLYPEFTTINQGFEKFRSPNGYFDVAIGNPPFGNFRINDPHNPQISRFSIHNFFIAKSVDSLRAGGITAMVVNDRLQVSFDEKPEKGSDAYRVMLLLKQQARFSFAPSQEKRWVRKLNDKAAIAAAGVLQTELPLPSTLAPAEQHSEPALTPHQHKDGESDLFGQHQLASEAPERLLSYDEILALEVTANELFSRHQEGECPDSTLYSAVSQLADTGSPEGKYLLAFCYFDGIGVKADSVRATELMHEAAAKGHSEASYKVGEMFETGEHGHVVDLKQAAHFYGKADPEFSKPARERVERLLGAVRPSVMSGFREILDQHKQQAESEAKFFSRMNLLYQRIIECQATLDCLKADLDIIDSSSPAIVTDRGAYLPGELQPDQMTELNRSLMALLNKSNF
ncbi:SEL1-like repeat protein [Pantoea agglomerans]|uniref:SEL1-like repeat protein n=1 Tax=Enterobacter agglomerans TaxID=549 RepID=A0ACC5PVC7_ENTAG|nr:SEL1-like repeat protein [Pantoea agglomerans]MBD8129221.1 SEL1-like repeat protein [Pantoea agglomerans]MBD8156456.1 SEL1-like repeat protein [Pantoea agglomerans]MBD8161204.1 SEL1-like repeat protein [Pantoea agglomerans]MBD8234842.1 SEL1-like repeat protein [Pantoea agglomerans]MBD8245266.1 SEL1-like repeat protein [Pantoea agglomerans]